MQLAVWTGSLRTKGAVDIYNTSTGALDLGLLVSMINSVDTSAAQYVSVITSEQPFLYNILLILNIFIYILHL